MSTVIEDQLRRVVLTIRSLKQEVADLKAAAGQDKAAQGEPIAVIGLGCRLPGGADSPDALWQMLVDGNDAIVTVPPERWDADRWYDPDPDRPGRMNSRWGGFLSGIDQFDPAFFELSSREATAMDPQQRLLLEVAWEAMEDGCLDPSRLVGSATGVFVGINASEYYDAAMQVPERLDAHALSGGVASVAAGRLSFLMGFSGPSIAVDTACSSSLTALHLAVQSLRNGESNLALAGGVYTVLRPNLTVALSKLHMMAPDGRCKSFDADADGFVQGEGCVLVALKRLSDALADGDPIRAVIRGSAANQDGRSGSLTAPSRDAQARVIRAALKDAGLEADRVGYVETHGTGTALGDPIEIHGMIDALGASRRRPLLLGALKSAIGHLGPAAGAAGFAKAILCLQRGQVPANLHFRTLNPNIELNGFPACFPDRLTGWPADDGNAGRVAAVSSFGFSGTNVHMVLSEAPQGPLSGPSPLLGDLSVLAVSARSPAALDDAIRRMIAALDDGCDLAGMAATSLTGRKAFEHRVAVVASSAAQARALLTERLAVPGPAVAPRARLGLWAGSDDGWQARLASWGVVPVAVDNDPSGDGIARLRALGCTVILNDRGLSGSDCLPLTGSERATMAGLLARLFEAGITVDWRLVHGPVRRARLPHYPFQRKSYWRPLDAQAATPPAEIPPGSRLRVPGDDWHFTLPLDLVRYPWLADHRVHGQTLVPGAFQVTCLAGAWWARHGKMPLRISDLTFARPLILSDSGVVDLCTSLSGDGRALLRSQPAGGDDDRWQDHADARILPGPAGPDTADLTGWRGRCTREIARDDWHGRLAALGIAIGPTFHGIRQMWSGNGGEAVARVSLPDAASALSGGTDGLMHPVLLDACLQVAGGAMSDSLRDEALLPVGIDSLVIWPESGVTDLWVHARQIAAGEVISTDITVASNDGRIILSLTGLHVRRAPALTIVGDRDIARLFHRLDWQPAMTGLARRSNRLLVLAAGADIGPWAGFGPVWQPGGSLGLADALMALGPDAEIVDLQGWSAGADTNPMALSAAAFALYQQVAGLVRLGRVTVAGYLLVASTGQGALAGLAQTMALEHPDWQPRCLMADSVGEVVAGLAAAVDLPDVWLRSGRDGISVPRLIRDLPEDSGNSFSLSGTVLITGGLGGLGRQTARWAAARGASHLVLISRSVTGTDADDFAASLPCPVTRIAVDLADPAFARGGAELLLQRLAADGLAPDAIFHSAGQQQPGMLTDLSDHGFAASLAAKADGAWALHRALLALGQTPRHFVMFSSLAGYLGAAGQGGYAPANAALDDLAYQRRAMGLPAQSIGWGRLADAGMAASLDQAASARVDGLGLRAIAPDMAMAALERAMASDMACPVIADVDWQRFADRHPSGRAPALLLRLLQSRSELVVPAASDDLLSRLVGAAAAILGGDVADIPVDRPLFQLGLDSLMAVELRNRITALIGRGPTVARLLGGASLCEIADSLTERLAADDMSATADADPVQADPSDEWEELTL